MRTTAAPVKDQTGRVVAAVAACQDITGEVELTAARNRLHDEVVGKTALLEAVVSHAPTGIVVTDAVGRFVSVNERFKTLFGSDVPATIHDYSRWSVRQEDGRTRDAARESALIHALRGETVTHKFQFRRSDGVERWVSITAAPVHDESHRIVAAVALCEDISDDVALMEARDRLLQQVDSERAKLRSLLTDLPIAALSRHLPDELVGKWDGDRLAQVVSNVVSNAVQHGDQARPIEVRLREIDQAAEFEVHSYGAPIPRDLLPVLFDPFRRGARMPNANPKGLGLGLYITHEIVAAHGGEVKVSSTSADGTTFIITLPIFPRERGSKASVTLGVDAEVNDLGVR